MQWCWKPNMNSLTIRSASSIMVDQQIFFIVRQTAAAVQNLQVFYRSVYKYLSSLVMTNIAFHRISVKKAQLLRFGDYTFMGRGYAEDM